MRKGEKERWVVFKNVYNMTIIENMKKWLKLWKRSSSVVFEESEWERKKSEKNQRVSESV